MNMGQFMEALAVGGGWGAAYALFVAWRRERAARQADERSVYIFDRGLWRKALDCEVRAARGAAVGPTSRSGSGT